MTLRPAKNMSKQPFFRRKNERITNVFDDYWSAKHVAIWYQRGQTPFFRSLLQECLMDRTHCLICVCFVDQGSDADF